MDGGGEKVYELSKSNELVTALFFLSIFDTSEPETLGFHGKTEGTCRKSIPRF